MTKFLYIFPCTLFTASLHSAVTINFDSLATETVVSNQFRSQGVEFFGNFVVQGPGPFNTSVSAPNSVFFSDPDDGTQVTSVFAYFYDPVSSLPSTTDFVSFTATDASSNGIFVINAYDTNDNLIGTNSNLIAASNTYVPLDDIALSVSVAGIAYVELTGSLTGAGNFGFEGDDFVFNEPAAIPEPASVAMLLGLGAFTLTVMRRK